MSDSKTIKFEILAVDGPLDITVNVLRFYSRHSLLSHGRVWELRLQLTDWRTWEPYLIGTDPFRLRVSSDAGETTGWLELYVDASKSDYRRNRLVATLRGGDALLKTALMAKTRAFSMMPVDMVVQRICADYGFTPRVDTMLGTKTWYQLQMTDYNFLNHLLGYAATSAGRGDIWFWFDNGIFNMRAINFLGAVEKTFIFGGIDDRAYKAPGFFRGGPVDRKGGRRFQVSAYDPLQKLAILKTTGTANPAGGPALGPYVPRAEINGLITLSIADTDPFIAEAVAKAKWGKVGASYFGIKISTTGDLSASVGTMLAMDFQKPDMQNSAFIRGKYPVFVVEHKYVKGLLHTDYLCFRREANYGAVPATGADASAVPGQDEYLAGLSSGTKPVQTTTITARPMA